MKNLRKTTTKTSMGGGDTMLPNNLSSKASVKRNFFKPVVASSLALFLGANFAYADCMNGGTPIICAGTEGSENKVDGLLNWNAVKLDPPKTTTYSPTLQEGGEGIPLERLEIKFAADGSKLTKENDNGTNATLKAGSDIASVVIKGNSKAIQMGKEGKGELGINFNSQANKNFTLDLSGTGDAISFVGGILIKGASNDSKFDAKFGNGMKGTHLILNIGTNTLTLEKGDLTLSEQIELRGTKSTTITVKEGNVNIPKISVLSADDKNSNLIFDFSSNANGEIRANIEGFDDAGGSITIKGNSTGTTKFIGNIGGKVIGTPNTKELNITLENTQMTGWIKTGRGGSGGGNDHQRKVITFKKTEPSGGVDAKITTKDSENFVLMGNIESHGTGYGYSMDKTKGNHITFEYGSMKGDILAGYDDSLRRGHNEVTFKGDQAVLEGFAKAVSAGLNEITFTQGGSIKGGVIATSDAFGDRVRDDLEVLKNFITFQGDKDASIIATNKDKIAIQAIARKNEIIFDGKTDNKIEGSIAADWFWWNVIQDGSNSILFTDSTSAKNTIQGESMTIRSNDSNASNIISIGAYTDSTQAAKANEDGAATSTNKINLVKMVADKGKNYLAKGILAKKNGTEKEVSKVVALENKTDTISFVDSTNAFVGDLSVHWIRSINGGYNNISFQASDKINENGTNKNAIIGLIGFINPEGNKSAVSGNNNVYLDLSKNTDFANAITIAQLLKNKDTTNPLAQLQSAILGNIDNGKNGTNNIKIVGGTSNSMPSVPGQDGASGSEGQGGASGGDSQAGSGSGSSSGSGAAGEEGKTETEMASASPMTPAHAAGSINLLNNGYQAASLAPVALKADASALNSAALKASPKATDMQNSSNIKIGFVGNITTDGGSNNLIFQDSIWLPDHIQNNGKEIKSFAGTSGTLINKALGNTNIVLRSSSSALNTLGTSVFNVTNAGADAKVNIVIQGQVNVGADINYGGRYEGSEYVYDGRHVDEPNTTTLIFANASSGTDSFETMNTDVKTNKILGVTYQDGIKLELKDEKIRINDNDAVSFLATYYNDFGRENKSLLSFTTNRTKESSSGNFKDSISIKGVAVGNISALERSDTNKEKNLQFDIVLENKSVFFGGFDFSKITQKGNNSLDKTIITLKMNQGSKFFVDNTVALQSLEIASGTQYHGGQILKKSFEQENTIIDLGSRGNDNDNISQREDFTLLSIGSVTEKPVEKETNTIGLKGNSALFRIYANASADQSKATLGGEKAQMNGEAKAADGKFGHIYADRVLVTQTQDTNNAQTEYVQILYSGSTSDITYHNGGTETEGNIAVFTVKNGSNNKALVNLETADVIQGFEQIGTTLKGVTTDVYGKVMSAEQGAMRQGEAQPTYTTYFIEGVGNKGITGANQQASSAALSSNYELYLANMNSLSKRMGELRNNANAQGVWARVFNGMQESNFYAKTTSLYTTFQAGYDYAFGMEGANNYLGFAISYINSLTSSEKSTDLDGNIKALKNSASNGVEFAIYNAYVQDGASSDTNYKNGFYSDTILKFSYIHNGISMYDQAKSYAINQYAITFSQEAGYRFLLGKSKEFFIDPQAELSLGFLNQGDFTQTRGNATLQAIQKAIFTLRGRVGSNFGYKFDQFTEDKGFKSQIYLGTYFTGDFISGGNINLISSKINTALSPLSSTARFTMNLGTNFTIKDHHRIYFDFERSFGGKITTIYQVNLGYRYSFGENKNYQPLNTALSSQIKKEKTIKKEQGK